MREISNLHTAKQIVRPEEDKKSQISNLKKVVTRPPFLSYLRPPELPPPPRLPPPEYPPLERPPPPEKPPPE